MKKPKTDVYTVILILSLCAILVGCGFLLAELARYDYKLTSFNHSPSVAAELTPTLASLPVAPNYWRA